MTLNYWAVVPAAGVGKRMGADVPKQYLSLVGKTVLEHTLASLLQHPRIQSVIVATSCEDVWWPVYFSTRNDRLIRVEGGAERCHSVWNGLNYLLTVASPEDWVLVHDAARPCVRIEDINRLIEAIADHPIGGLLALPVSDTVKRANAQGEVVETIIREGLWRALTPQIFRLGKLYKALTDAITAGIAITDEASALEWAGFSPRLVQGSPDNIKITHPQDLVQAEAFFNQRERSR